MIQSGHPTTYHSDSKNKSIYTRVTTKNLTFYNALSFCFCFIIGNFEQFSFPSDLFSTRPVQFNPITRVDNTFKAEAFLDGFFAVSEEGNLSFINDLTAILTWRRDAYASWIDATESKGLTCPTFQNGLPLFYINSFVNYSLWATFIPDSPTNDRQPLKLTHFKTLYDFIFEEVVFTAIRELPDSSTTKMYNPLIDRPKPSKYKIMPLDLQDFSDNFTTCLKRYAASGSLPENLRLHFVAKSFGQDVPTNEHTIRSFEVCI